jgi:hypothetical protein
MHRRNSGRVGPAAHGWFQAITPVIDAAWNGVVLEDFRLPELARERPLHLRPMQWYMERVQRAPHRSAFVTDRFCRVMNFLEPPSAFFSPRTMAEVLLPAFGGTHRGNVRVLESCIHAGHIGIAAGTFFDPVFPPPTISAWERSKHPWMSFAGTALHLREQTAP